MRSKKRKIISLLDGVLFTALLFAFATTIFVRSKHKHQESIVNLNKDINLHFYFYDFDEYKKLELSAKKESIKIALQAMNDHFGMKIQSIKISHKKLPKFIAKKNFKIAKIAQLAFWQKSVFKANWSDWLEGKNKELPILVSNFPLSFNPNNDSHIINETRHLAPHKLISGLAHPTFILVSAYRLLNPSGAKHDFEISNSQDQARFLGEYIIAHELGHSLLGLKDYIIESSGQGRKLASLTKSSLSESNSCLMHTDEKGGTEAWLQIKNRRLGHRAGCNEYHEQISYYQQRKNIFKEFKIGNKSQAVKAFEELLSKAKYNVSEMHYRKWQHEAKKMKLHNSIFNLNIF